MSVLGRGVVSHTKAHSIRTSLLAISGWAASRRCLCPSWWLSPAIAALSLPASGRPVVVAPAEMMIGERPDYRAVYDPVTVVGGCRDPLQFLLEHSQLSDFIAHDP